MLTFNPETHEYRKENGDVVPSVTQIINEWIKVTIGGERWHINRFTGAAIPSRKMEEGAAKGSDLHKGAQLILQGGIDWASLADEYVKPLKQFEQWLKDFQPEALYTEAKVYHPRYNYAGMIDLVMVLDKKLFIVDIKTGGYSRCAGLQLAAYLEGWVTQEKYTGRTARAVLSLPKDGSSYKFEEITGDNDFNLFRACLLLKGALK